MLFSFLIVLVLILFGFLSFSVVSQEQEISDRVRKRRKSKRKYFYIYDWPPDIMNCWPLANTHERQSIDLKFRDNYGIGPLMNAEVGMYHTHQYSLFYTFYHRLLESPHRTLDPEKATKFFIPYDIGMDSSTRQEDGALFQTNCPKLQQVLDLLSNSRYYQESHGTNHFTLHSINQPMNYYLNLRCMEFYRACYNCTKFSIDTYTQDMYPVLRDYPEMRHKWRSIPFPSNFHMSSNVTKVLWKENLDVHRKYAIAYMGSAGITSRLSKELRLVLKEQCSKISDCYLIELESHTSQTDIFKSQSNFPYGVYAESTFCLMPGGDFPTRKAFVDALLSGCIPVTFNPFTAINQMPYHWGNTKNARLVVVNIPRDQMIQNPSFEFEKLVSWSFNESFVMQRRKRIAQIGHRFQYNVPGGSSIIKEKNNHQTIDAVDVIIRSLFIANMDNVKNDNTRPVDNQENKKEPRRRGKRSNRGKLGFING